MFWQMGKKRIKKSKVMPGEAAQVETPTASSPAIASYPPVVTTGVFGREIVMPPPEHLLMEAEDEPNYRDLSHYASVIRTLRDKGFSYRDIAEWLSKRGVDVDHNAVYRVYTNSV